MQLINIFMVLRRKNTDRNVHIFSLPLQLSFLSLALRHYSLELLLVAHIFRSAISHGPDQSQSIPDPEYRLRPMHGGCLTICVVSYVITTYITRWDIQKSSASNKYMRKILTNAFLSRKGFGGSRGDSCSIIIKRHAFMY